VIDYQRIDAQLNLVKQAGITELVRVMEVVFCSNEASVTIIVALDNVAGLQREMSISCHRPLYAISCDLSLQFDSSNCNARNEKIDNWQI